MNDSKEYWAFRFCLEAENNSLVERARAEELLDVIVQWAEANGLQVGGGYREPVEEDRTAPLYGEEGYREI